MLPFYFQFGSDAPAHRANEAAIILAIGRFDKQMNVITNDRVIINSDGKPLRKLLEDFVNRIDFAG